MTSTARTPVSLSTIVTEPESCRIVYKEGSGWKPEPEGQSSISNTITQLQPLQIYRIQCAVLSDSCFLRFELLLVRLLFKNKMRRESPPRKQRLELSLDCI